MPAVKLHSGYFAPNALEENGEYLEKDALFVYRGTHVSAEGPVDVTDEQIERLAANHNARVNKAFQLNGGKILAKDCPPIQLDHSPGADVTIGRVWGAVVVGETEIDVSLPEEPIRLEKRKALFGRTRFMGAENIEKVKDGRWVHGSIGADFENGKFNEFTVTPFPAAENARLLSSVKFSLPSKGESMDKEKLKKHLTEQRKLSDQDANLRLNAMNEKELSELSAEVDEQEKKLAAEAEEKEKARLAAEAEEKQKADEKLAAEKLAADEKEKKEKEEADKKELSARKAQDTKLAAAKDGFSKLAKGLVATFSDSKLTARKANIGIRLSKLRTEAKLSPAEQKGIDIAKLAAKSDDAVEAFFEAFESREQVIPVGQYGSTRAESATKLAAKVAKAASKNERLSNMPFTSKAISNTKGKDSELSASAELAAEEPKVEKDSEEEEKQLSACLAFLTEGKKDEASKCLREYVAKCRKGNMAGEMNPETESHLSALAESNKKLHNQLEEIVKLVGPVLGIKLEDLN